MKLATFQKTLKTPEVLGDPEGDMLVVGWGSTKGAIEEAVERVRKDGLKVSSIHLKYLYPMAPGLKEIFKKFKKIITVEINYSDDRDNKAFDGCLRRPAQLCWYLRASFMMDIDYWSIVCARPLKPVEIENMLRARIKDVQ